jgi:hypothetical protein
MLDSTMPANERCFLTEAELADRWRLSLKTIARWRSQGTGPIYARFGKTIRYPMTGPGGILQYEKSILASSTTQRAVPQ